MASDSASPDPDMLVAGVRRMRPDDHFMVLTETDATPMHVGALVILAVPSAEKAGFAAALRGHIAARLAHTPLLAVLRQAPDGYDSDVWVDVPTCDLDYHIQTAPGPEMDDSALHAFVAARIMERLDLSRPPFQIHVIDKLSGERCAFYIKMHHAVADGIGFQTVLGLLSDETAPAPPRRTEGHLPSDDEWRRLADERFAREAPLVEQVSARRKRAQAALAELQANPQTRRATTPTLKLFAATADKRIYTTLSLSLPRLRAISRALNGTINDIFLAIAAAAVRRYLIEIDDLPADPLVINSARSYRQSEHGAFGNRIVALHPHLATHVADAIERLRAIQASMAVERLRTEHDEAMLGQLERPHGARDRRTRFATRTADGAAVLAGNITLSNVPGPAAPRFYAGFRQIANYPAPLLGSGRFLNITSRRNGDSLDMGIAADPTKIASVEKIAQYVRDAADEYEKLATPDPALSSKRDILS